MRVGHVADDCGTAAEWVSTHALDQWFNHSRCLRAWFGYDLPIGDQEQGAVNICIMKMVMIIAVSGTTYATSQLVIVLAEMPISGGVDKEEMMLQIQLSMRRLMENQNLNMELAEKKVVTIRGQEVPLLVYEGTSDQGVSMKQVVSCLFDGKYRKLKRPSLWPK